MPGRSIFGMFSKSPFGPTQGHLKKTIECAQQLRPLFVAVYAGDQEELVRVTDRINVLEHEIGNHQRRPYGVRHSHFRVRRKKRFQVPRLMTA